MSSWWSRWSRSARSWCWASWSSCCAGATSRPRAALRPTRRTTGDGAAALPLIREPPLADPLLGVERGRQHVRDQALQLRADHGDPDLHLAGDGLDRSLAVLGEREGAGELRRLPGDLHRQVRPPRAVPGLALHHLDLVADDLLGEGRDAVRGQGLVDHDGHGLRAGVDLDVVAHGAYGGADLRPERRVGQHLVDVGGCGVVGQPVREPHARSPANQRDPTRCSVSMPAVNSLRISPSSLRPTSGMPIVASPSKVSTVPAPSDASRIRPAMRPGLPGISTSRSADRSESQFSDWITRVRSPTMRRANPGSMVVHCSMSMQTSIPDPVGVIATSRETTSIASYTRARKAGSASIAKTSAGGASYLSSCRILMAVIMTNRSPCSLRSLSEHRTGQRVGGSTGRVARRA